MLGGPPFVMHVYESRLSEHDEYAEALATVVDVATSFYLGLWSLLYNVSV
jgi:hypothetical protein